MGHSLETLRAFYRGHADCITLIRYEICVVTLVFINNSIAYKYDRIVEAASDELMTDLETWPYILPRDIRFRLVYPLASGNCY